MVKRVFFSFHYQDVADLRANVVRNHWVTKPNRADAGYFDASVWESAKKQGDIAIKRLINGALQNTSNTCVLIGSQTYARPWVRYELLKSFRKGNHLFGVHINQIRGKDRRTKPLGPNPLDYVGVVYSEAGTHGTLFEKVGSDWREYDKLDGSASFACNVAAQFRGKGFNLGAWYDTYCWKSNDGYNQFSAWTR